MHELVDYHIFEALGRVFGELTVEADVPALIGTTPPTGAHALHKYALYLHAHAWLPDGEQPGYGGFDGIKVGLVEDGGNPILLCGVDTTDLGVPVNGCTL